MVNSSTLNSRYLLFYFIIVVLVVAIPLHFYIASELENARFRDNAALKRYAQKVANKIYNFSNSSAYVFHYPRSNIYQSAIYNNNDKTIFSLLKQPIDPNFNKVIEKNSNRYLRYPLKNNIFNASYLVVSKPISYSSLIINVIAILIVISILLFFAILSLIHQSAAPYKKLNQYLEDFLRDAMHEVKTPMGVMLLNLDGIKTDNKHNNRMLQRARSALKNMIVVYEDLEFFVRFKKVNHPKQEIDFSTFLNERILFFGDLLSAKEIDISTDIDSNISIFFSPIELSRIIDNTISNAIKYSKEKTEIYISLKQNSGRVVLYIRDQGKGIEDVDKIFQRYYRGDKISGGFGIGLSIVKNICDRNRVQIDVESKPAQGAKFAYTFQKN